MRSLQILFTVALMAFDGRAAPMKSFHRRQDAGKMVFAHFMMGTQAHRSSAADYDNDMQRAKAAGIDAFVLNIAKDTYTSTQLEYAYESAGKNGMKVAMSFDYNEGDIYFGAGDVDLVAKYIKDFADKEAQLKIDNKVFVSSFNGDSSEAHRLEPEAIRGAAGVDLFFIPNFNAGKGTDLSGVDGSFNWMAWHSNGANRAPTPGSNVTTSDADKLCASYVGDKAYMASVSPWFFTNFPSKQWNFPGDLLWFTRWTELLELSPRFIEIITWNDYGESHYLAPASDDHDPTSQAWTAGMPHDGWLEMAEPYIAAFKAGAKQPAITQDKLIYWYRPSLKAGCQCDGVETLQDAVFVVSLLTKPGKLTIKSGDNVETIDAPAGASVHQVAMGPGKPSFSLTGGATELSGEGELAIKDSCDGALNLNAFVGTIKSASGSNYTFPVGNSNQTYPAGNYTMPNPMPTGTGVTKPATMGYPSATVTGVASTLAVYPPKSAPAPEEAEIPNAETTASPTKTQQSGACSVTVTASDQVRPTNCLAAGQAWGGAGEAPSCCDGAACCR